MELRTRPGGSGPLLSILAASKTGEAILRVSQRFPESDGDGKNLRATHRPSPKDLEQQRQVATAEYGAAGGEVA